MSSPLIPYSPERLAICSSGGGSCRGPNVLPLGHILPGSCTSIRPNDDRHIGVISGAKPGKGARVITRFFRPHELIQNSVIKRILQAVAGFWHNVIGLIHRFGPTRPRQMLNNDIKLASNMFTQMPRKRL